MKTVAFYGEIGAYSEQAAMKIFGKNAEYIPYRYLTDIFADVASKIDYGVVPIENSIEGAVTQTYDLLLTSDLHIIGETILRINHCLMVLPGVKAGSIKRVYSHPQALGQCKRYIERLGADPVPLYDTAGSARMIKEEGMRDAAAIASERAAEIYGMKILARDIETNRSNYTRFFIISRKKDGKGEKTSTVFSLKSYPGALFHALDAFAKNKVDLTYIQSRPVLGKPWQYNFYVDFDGDIHNANVSAAMKDLKRSTTQIKVLGSYRKARK